jgi:hypothetical protein
MKKARLGHGCLFCELSGRGLCDGPIPRPEEPYRLCFLSVLARKSALRISPSFSCLQSRGCVSADTLLQRLKYNLFGL